MSWWDCPKTSRFNSALNHLTDLKSTLKFSSTVQPINKNNDHSKNGTAPNGMPLPAVVVTSEVDPNGPVDKVWLILYKLEDMSSPGRPIIMHKEEYRKHSVAIVIVQNKTLNSQQVDWISMVTRVPKNRTFSSIHPPTQIAICVGRLKILTFDQSQDSRKNKI